MDKMDDLGNSTEGMEQDIEILEETDNIQQSRTDSNNLTSELSGSGNDEYSDIKHTLRNVPEGDNPMDDTAANKRDVLGDSIDPTRQNMEQVDSLQTGGNGTELRDHHDHETDPEIDRNKQGREHDDLKQENKVSY